LCSPPAGTCSYLRRLRIGTAKLKQKISLMPACRHEFCETCITTYAQSKVKDGEVLPQQMSCPHAEPKPCGVALAHADILLCLPDKSDKERFERLSLQRSRTYAQPT
jgi:hypothetical protein